MNDEVAKPALLDRLLDVGREGWLRRVERLVDAARPFGARPTSPLETLASVESFEESLMPRTSLHQGVVTGASILFARGVGNGVERFTDLLVSPASPLALRLFARGLIGSAGAAMMRLPETEAEPTSKATARSAGRILAGAAIGGALYDVASRVDRYVDSRYRIPSLLASTAGIALVAGTEARNLRRRRAAVKAWSKPQKLTYVGSIASAGAVVGVGTAIELAQRQTRHGIRHWLGPGPVKTTVADVLNAGLWGTIATGAYWALISKVGAANEKVDPGYAAPPNNPRVSGSPESVVPFDELGQQGRRYVIDTLTADLIGEVMQEPAQADPIRTFIGYDSEPLYELGRAELALEELVRTNAFDRKHLLLVCPTGTGWVDHTMIESVEFLTRGNVATCCIQYGRYPSFLSLQKVRAGRRQFRALLWGVKQQLQARPPERRPTVFVFGESLGAWASSDVVMFQGIDGFDHYGIDKALWFGMPYLAKWSKEGMSNPGPHTPPGSCGVFDRHEQMMELSPDERSRLRAVLVSHDNDPITRLGPSLFVKRPDWLGPPPRGRNVPDRARWTPFITGVQTAIDAANAMVNVPGEFRSFGHDYRLDTAGFVRDGYGLDATEDQLERVVDALKRLETERAARIKGETEAKQDAPKSPQQVAEEEERRSLVPLRDRRTGGARWLQRRRSSRAMHASGAAPAD